MNKWAQPIVYIGLVLPMVAATARAADTRKSPAKPDANVAALSQLIDRAIDQRLAVEKVKPSPRASDAEFLRRVYLDLAGEIPPADKAAAFLDSKDPDKRAQVIDELLASPGYARHLADIWEGLLVPRTSDTRRVAVQPLRKWLEDSFAENKPWDRFVTELLTATGSTEDNGAVTFFVTNPTPDKLTDQTSRLFLGVQLQCAQCHNHPFTHWKQTEYWGMAAFFTKVRMNGRPKQAAKNGTTLTVEEQQGTAKRGGKAAKLPESAKIVPAKFFQGEEPKLNPAEPYRPVLARWLTAADNPFFARAIVNRTWYQLFGRGFVQPVDDLHEGNAPSHPELLQELSARLAAGGFDLKLLIRAICNSHTYQRTSKPFAGNDGDNTLFSHMAVKSMSPEQLYDSLTAVLGTGGKGNAKGRQGPNQKGQGGNQRSAFVAFFQTDDGANPTEFQAGIPQALRLMNSPQLNTDNAAVLNQLLKSKPAPRQVVEHLCLATLARRPTAAEAQHWTTYLSRQSDLRKGASDLLWALLNSSEFSLNH
jgi:hypothetical protein